VLKLRREAVLPTSVHSTVSNMMIEFRMLSSCNRITRNFTITVHPRSLTLQTEATNSLCREGFEEWKILMPPLADTEIKTLSNSVRVVRLLCQIAISKVLMTF